MESSFNLSLFLVVAGFQSCLIQGTAEEVWSDCPQNLMAYEGCPYTVHAIFTATDGLDCNDYKFTISINEDEYHSSSDIPLSVVQINGSSSQCNASVTIPVEDIVHNVTFTASRFPQTPQISCEDLLEVVNGNLSAPDNLIPIVTWDQLYLSWTQPNNLLEGYSIDNYAIVINGRSYFTNDTRIAISITDAELAINGEYNVSVNPSYCRGEGMTANATVVIANRPSLAQDVSKLSIAGDSNNESLVLVQLSSQVSDNDCKVSHPTSITMNHSCSDMDTVAMPTQDVTVNCDGSILTNVTLPINDECHVNLVFSNSNTETTTISTNTIYTDNLRNCRIEVFEPDLVLFTCDCIHSDYECCNVSVANERQQLVYNTGTNGYIQLPAGNYTVECVSLNTSRVVSEKNVMLLEGKINVSPASVCTTTGSISLSDMITSSINLAVAMNTDTCVDDNFNFYIALGVCVPLIIILLILLIISLSWQFCRRCRSRSPVRKPTTVEDDDQPSDHLEQMRLSRLNNGAADNNTTSTSNRQQQGGDDPELVHVTELQDDPNSREDLLQHTSTGL